MGEDIDDGIADAGHVEGPSPRRSERTHRRRPYAGSVSEREPTQPEPDFQDPAVVDPYRLPEGVTPVRYDLTLVPDLGAATFAGTCATDAGGGGHHARGQLQRPRAGDRHRLGRHRRRTSDRHHGDHPGRGDRAGHLHLRRGPARRPGHPPHRVPGSAQRQAEGLLPLDLHRRRRRRAGHRHHPVRGHRRPPGLPVLGRTRPQGRLRRHPRRRRGPVRGVQRGRDLPHPERRPSGPPRGPLRRDDGDVDLPRGVHRGPARGHRPGRCRRHPSAGRVPEGQGPPHGLRPRGRRRLPAPLRRLLRHRLPGRQARPGRRARLRLRGHGEPGLRHLPGDPPAGRPRPPRPRPSC